MRRRVSCAVAPNTARLFTIITAGNTLCTVAHLRILRERAFNDQLNHTVQIFALPPTVISADELC